jgi:hypothetical protein
MAAALGVIAGVGLLASILPGVGQANGEILALTVPVNGALVLSSFWLFDGPGSGDGLAPPEKMAGRSEGGTG